MMNFEQRYSNEPLGNLVHIIEHAEDYQPQAVEAARKVIRRRGLSQSDILSAARAVMTKRVHAYLDNFSVVNDSFQLPKSAFLNEEEVKLVFRTCFTERKNEFDDMIPDAWKYAIGGI